MSAGWQHPDAIRDAAEQAVIAQFADTGGRISVAAVPVDPRLRMPACEQALTASVANTTQDSSRVSAAVRCDGLRPWRLFVPVRVSLHRTLVVTAAPLERGKVLAAGDVILTEREVGASPGGYLTAVEAAAGKVLRRSLPAGAVLSPALLEAPLLVRRGQQVTLEARSGTIAVRMAGVARDDGALGQLVAVQNLSSRKILQGIVRNEKSVEVLVP